MKVAVVGGGVVGLALAEALSRRGADVTVIEAGVCGAGASAGNCGWVTPGLCSPIPSPGTMGQAMRWMLSPRSPLAVRPTPSISFARWTYDFWRSTRPRMFSSGMAMMMALSQRVIADFDALAQCCSFEMHSQGILFVGQHKHSVAEELRLLRECQALGYAGDIVAMDPDEAAAQEPGLRGQCAGAIYAPDERHLRPETLTAGLRAELERRGVGLREHSPVEELIPDGNDGWSLQCGSDVIGADRVVLANGLATRSLLAPLGVRLPLEPGKGYSVTAAGDARGHLRGPVYLLESRVGISPFDDGVRLAGTLELGARGEGLSRSRVDSIQTTARQAFGEWTDALEWTGWAGFRTLLPDGLPVIGPVPGHRGLHVATGHGMVGVTLAPTTAELLAPAILDDAPSLQLTPFSLARFDNRGHVPNSRPHPPRSMNASTARIGNPNLR